MKIFLALTGLIISSSTYAGTISAGGGSASVCRNGLNQIVNAELVDLTEARLRYQHTIPELTISVEQQVLGVINRIQGEPAIARVLEETYRDILDRQILLTNEVGLHISNDLGSTQAVYINAGCPLEQVGYYETDGILRIASNVFSALSPTNQAAFYLHETVYRLLRDAFGDADSMRTRQLIAKLFTSDLSDEEVTRAVKTALTSSDVNAFVLKKEVGGVFRIVAPAITTATITTYDIKGNILESRRFTLDTDLRVEGVARIALSKASFEFVALNQNEKRIFLKKFDRPFNGAFQIFLGN